MDLEQFLRSDLKWIKKHNLGDLKKDGKKIIVSTCYFLPEFIIEQHKNTFNYLTTFIENVELFKYKIDKIHTGEEIKDQYILRIYIDRIILDLNILENIKTATKNNKNNNNLSQFINKYEETKDAYNYITLCIREYIERICNSNDEKYKNIEIISYFNNDLTKHLISNPNTIVSGHFKTFGTLMRYHPILMSDTNICIMRNLGDQITLLDLYIQKYWIDKTDKKYMEYYWGNYIFQFFENYIYRKVAYLIYNIVDTDSKSKGIGLDDVKLFFILGSRSLGGLIACKNNIDDHKVYKDLFTQLENNFFFKDDIDLKLEERFFYGIDEMIITYLFRDLRNHFNYKPSNNTFFIDIDNYNCNLPENNNNKPINQMIINKYKNFKLIIMQKLNDIKKSNNNDTEKKLIDQIKNIFNIIPLDNLNLKLQDKYYLPYNYLFSSRFLGDFNIMHNDTSQLLFLLHL